MWQLASYVKIAGFGKLNFTASFFYEFCSNFFFFFRLTEKKQRGHNLCTSRHSELLLANKDNIVSTTYTHTFRISMTFKTYRNVSTWLPTGYTWALLFIFFRRVEKLHKWNRYLLYIIMYYGDEFVCVCVCYFRSGSWNESEKRQTALHQKAWIKSEQPAIEYCGRAHRTYCRIKSNLFTY